MWKTLKYNWNTLSQLSLTKSCSHRLPCYNLSFSLASLMLLSFFYPNMVIGAVLLQGDPKYRTQSIFFLLHSCYTVNEFKRCFSKYPTSLSDTVVPTVWTKSVPSIWLASFSVTMVTVPGKEKTPTACVRRIVHYVMREIRELCDLAGTTPDTSLYSELLT